MANNFKILSSKKLTDSFREVKGHDVWESISLSQKEAAEIVSRAISKLKPTNEPLTITITIGD